MSSARVRPRILIVAAAACALGAACSSPVELHGSPVLTQVYWIAGGQRLLAWALDMAPALVSPVPPFASEIDFVFDRRLDGYKIEDVITVDGVMMTRPKETPSVRASWPDMGTAMSDPPFHLVVDYNPGPEYGGVSSFVYARPDVPGFPSSDTVTFELVPALLTSPSGELADIPAKIPVKTTVFAATFASSTSAVVRSYQFPLTFSNRLPAAPAMSPHVHVRASGADVPYKLLADPSLASRWYLGAADCLGAWPAGTTFDVTIDADFADAFGGKLGQVATATFSTGAGSVAVDASCSVPEAGIVDAAADGGVDAGTDASETGDGSSALADAPGDIAAEAGVDSVSSADAD